MRDRMFGGKRYNFWKWTTRKDMVDKFVKDGQAKGFYVRTVKKSDKYYIYTRPNRRRGEL